MTEQRVGFRIRTGVVVLEVSCHVLVQIICLYFLAEVVGVCKQKPPSVTSVLTSHTIIMKVVHEHFRQLQHYETSVHGFHLHNPWHRYLGPLMFAVRDTLQDSTGFTPFELLYGHKVRTPMTLLKRIWTDEDEDPEVKTLYQYVVDLRDRVEETCKMAKEELAKVQVRNQKYYNKRTRDRKLQVGDSVLLLLPTERNKLTLAWRATKLLELWETLTTGSRSVQTRLRHITSTC